MSSAELTDAQLVQRCRAGDDAAWRQLVERFSRYVYAIATKGFRLPEHDAEDIFQEVFTRTYQRLDRLRDDGAIKPWLAQLTRNLCLDRLRETSRMQPTDEEFAVDTDETLAQLDVALTVRGALEGLGPPCSELLDRFFCRDESYKTIGSELDLPAGTIASRISRCLVKLREGLEGRTEDAPASGSR